MYNNFSCYKNSIYVLVDVWKSINLSYLRVKINQASRHYSKQLGVSMLYRDINCFLHVFVLIRIISIWIAQKPSWNWNDNSFGSYWFHFLNLWSSNGQRWDKNSLITIHPNSSLILDLKTLNLKLKANLNQVQLNFKVFDQ